MSQLGVTVVSGEPIVAPLVDSGINTPPVYLYSHFQNYLEYHLAEDLTPWANADDVSFGVPIRSSSGPIIFNGTEVTIDPGRYSVVIDATAMGTLDSEFTGFKVEVSISANPPNDPNSQSSKIVPATLLPNGNSTYTPKYVSGSNTLIATPLVANCTPAQLQTSLNLLDALTGGITVLTAVGPHQSFVGGPYFVQFNTVGAKKLLRFNTTNSLSVATARIVTGDGSTQEIQKIVLNRPLTIVALDILAQVLFDGSHTWTLQVYLTNPRTTATTIRRLAIHNIWLYKIASKLYEITAGDGVINATEVFIGSGTIPSATAGGFKARVQENAAVAYDHEALVYSANALAGATSANPKLPAAHLLTGSTVDRTESVIIQSNVQLPNAPTPPTVPPIIVKLLVDNGGPPNPNSPPLTPIVTLQEVKFDFVPEDSGLAIPYPRAGTSIGSTIYVTDGQVFYSSTNDGVTFTTLGNIGVIDFVLAVVRAASQFVAVGIGGVVYTSPDANTWTQQTSATVNDMQGIAYGGGVYVAVGSAGDTMSSSNGTSWTLHPTGGIETLVDVAFGAGQFVAVGETGAIYTSPNGSTWTLQTSGTSVQLTGVTYGGGLWMVSGWTGTVLTSVNGTAWTALADPTGSAADLKDCAFGTNGVANVWTVITGATTYMSTNGTTFIQTGPLSHAPVLLSIYDVVATTFCVLEGSPPT